MRVFMIACGHTLPTDGGSSHSPAHISTRASSTPRFLISVRTSSQYFAPPPPPPAHKPRMSRLPSIVPALHVDRVDEHHRVQGPVLPPRHPVDGLVDSRRDRRLRHSKTRRPTARRYPRASSRAPTVTHHILDRPPARRRFATITGVNLPAPSRGTPISIEPALASTFFDRLPFRALPVSATAPFSW